MFVTSKTVSTSMHCENVERYPGVYWISGPTLIDSCWRDRI